MKTLLPFLIIFFESSILLSQNPNSWDQAEIKHIFDLVAQSKTEEAVKLVEARGTTAYDFGRDLIYGLNQSEKALDWYAVLVLYYEGELEAKAFYGKAWTHWQRGEYSQALKDAELLLSAATSDLILARTHYLMGLIRLKHLEFAASKYHFEQGEALYRSLGKKGGQFLCTLEKAHLAIAEGNYQLARTLLKDAGALNRTLKKPYPLGRIFEMRSEIHFREGRYAPSLADSRRARQAYEDSNQNEMALWARIRSGFLLALLGDFGAAYDEASALDDIILQKNLVKHAHYNNITWILLYRCRDQDESLMKEEIEKWVALNDGGERLLELVRFVEGVQCPP